jgi:hypothetical protein
MHPATINQGPLNSFVKKTATAIAAQHENMSDSNESDLSSSQEPSTSKRFRSTFNRQHDSSYIQFSFLVLNDEEVPKPQCTACSAVLLNDAMKTSKLKRYLHTKRIELTSTPVEFFERKRADLKGHQKQIFQLFHINTVAL